MVICRASSVVEPGNPLQGRWSGRWPRGPAPAGMSRWRARRGARRAACSSTRRAPSTGRSGPPPRAAGRLTRDETGGPSRDRHAGPVARASGRPGCVPRDALGDRRKYFVELHRPIVSPSCLRGKRSCQSLRVGNIGETVPRSTFLRRVVRARPDQGRNPVKSPRLPRKPGSGARWGPPAGQPTSGPPAPGYTRPPVVKANRCGPGARTRVSASHARAASPPLAMARRTRKRAGEGAAHPCPILPARAGCPDPPETIRTSLGGREARRLLR